MKLLDKYFQPYAEYCIRTTFSEDELKAVLKKECPATGDILSLKALRCLPRKTFLQHPLFFFQPE